MCSCLQCLVPATPPPAILVVVRLTNFYFFSAQLAAVNEELRLAREAPADRTPAQIARPREVKNLQAAMGLKNDRGKYQTFKVSVRSCKVCRN
jgi:hypothetical protein